MKPNEFSIFTAIVFLIFACSSSPKVIEPVSDSNESFLPDKQPLTSEFSEHKIRTKEILYTDKYTYLFVEEEGVDNYWIAISKREVSEGEEFIYRGGLMKKNFYSSEFDRVFETILLVGEIISLSGVSQNVQIDPDLTKAPKSVRPVEGAIKLKELISNADSYSGKRVRVTGKCVKINPMIMGKNWVHIQDESGSNFDLTITTSQNIALGQIVSMEGIFSTNKDFGAGYFYKVILEDASVL